MKHSAGLVLALASAAPALARDPAPGPRQAGDDPTLRALTGATATDDGGVAALAEGRTHLAAGNAAQAISSFRLALSADQSSIAALNGLGIAYDRLGRNDLARRHFETALSLEPDAADIAYNLGYSLHLAGDHRAAVPWLQRAAGGNDGRAAAAARRLLTLIAARLEAEAINPSVIAPAQDSQTGPVRVASARIDMASSGEAVLVLPSTVNHPATSAPVLMAGANVPALAPRLALSVPVARLVTAALSVPMTDVSALTVAAPVVASDALPQAQIDVPAADAPPALRMAAADSPETATPARLPLAVRDVMATRLGALAALTIPLAAPMPVIAAPTVPTTEQVAPASVIRVAARAVTRAFARPQPAQETAAQPVQAELPRVITLGDTPPDFSSLLPDAPAMLEPPAAPPLRLLDLAALPLLATATPLAPLPLLAPPRIAVDWLAGTDIDHLAPEAAPPAYQRLMNALLAQADLADAVDPQAVRMAIDRLEALVSRIQSFSLEVMRA
jgi:hypothetical protein